MMKFKIIYGLALLNLWTLVFFAQESSRSEAIKGNLAFEEGDYKKAEEYYKMAIKAKPPPYGVYFNLGNTYLSQEKWQEAASSYGRFIDQAQDNNHKSLGLYNIGYIHAKNEKWEEASKFFSHVLKLNPNDLDAKHNLELALKKIKQQQQQQQNASKKNDLPPPTAYAKQIKAQSDYLMTQRKYKEAHQLLKEALKKDETVGNYQDHITRIGEIVNIIDN